MKDTHILKYCSDTVHVILVPYIFYIPIHYSLTPLPPLIPNYAHPSFGRLSAFI